MVDNSQGGEYERYHFKKRTTLEQLGEEPVMHVFIVR